MGKKTLSRIIIINIMMEKREVIEGILKEVIKDKKEMTKEI